jgi:hypothetical protein
MAARVPQMSDHADEDVGFGKPPKATQFQKGRSGNPRGRPRGSKRDIPYDHLLGQMVTIREEGRERRVTAAEAFLLQLTKKGLEGCGASTRASLASIEQARVVKQENAEETLIVRLIVRSFGICCTVEDFGMAVRLNPTSKEKCRLELKPWIVQAAVDRMLPNQLSAAEQAIVLASTRTPEKVAWPAWWTARG